jgi:hypothetical protein
MRNAKGGNPCPCAQLFDVKGSSFPRFRAACRLIIEHRALWLGEMIPNTFIRPAAENVVRVWPIGTTVGKIKNGGPKLLKPPSVSEIVVELLTRHRAGWTSWIRKGMD